MIERYNNPIAMIKILMIRLTGSVLVLAGLLFTVPVLAQASDTAEPIFIDIDELLNLGAPELALKRLDKKQPALLENNMRSWLLWERKRIELMQKLQHWNLIVERIEKLGIGRTGSSQEKNASNLDVPDQDENWFSTQKIKAYLKLDNNQAALTMLRQLLWNTEGYIESDLVAIWRRQVIQSYLQLNKIEDAQRAMRRYQQDYGSVGNEESLQWTLLQMQLLMRTHRYQEVIRSLSDAGTDEEKAILLVAKIEANTQPPQQIAQQLKKQWAKKIGQLDHKAMYDYVLLKAAMADKLAFQITSLLETLLIAQKTENINDVFFDASTIISADHLWAAYETLGYETANRYKLLRGDDDAWYLKASNLFEQKPVQARAMYAVLAFHAQTESHRNLAFEQLARLLRNQESGAEIIHALFMKSSRIPDIEQVPVQIRYLLVDYALSRADLKSAAKLMENLQQPPEGKEIFDWHLRRARILVMGGQHQQGATILDQLLASKKQLSEPEVDQYMQILFDLQAIEAHALALKGFDKLEQYPLSEKVKREVTFWKAESYQAMGEYEQAAYLFLRSAQPLDNQFDPWFHTASFKAAESLVQAKLMDDARRQYIKLLRITKNQARKSVIKQRLQQIRLLKSNAK